MRRNILYRIFSAADELLYVGATTNPNKRFADHHRHQPWWDEADHITLERFDTLESMLAAEEAAIKSEAPKYNLAYTHNMPPVWSYKRERKKGTGTFYQRKLDGLWVGRVELPAGPDGKRRHRFVSSMDRLECMRKLELLRAQVDAERNRVNP